ncbi:hypothetical protein D3C85_1583230 [compost metagenome]
MRTAQGIGDLLARLFGAVATHLRLGAGAQTRVTELQHARCRGALERLGIGVHADEFHALHATADHVLHGVAARTAHAHHLDDGAVLHLRFDHVKVHHCLREKSVPKRCSLPAAALGS